MWIINDTCLTTILIYIFPVQICMVCFLGLNFFVLKSPSSPEFNCNYYIYFSPPDAVWIRWFFFSSFTYFAQPNIFPEEEGFLYFSIHCSVRYIITFQFFEWCWIMILICMPWIVNKNISVQMRVHACVVFLPPCAIQAPCLFFPVESGFTLTFIT